MDFLYLAQVNGNVKIWLQIDTFNTSLGTYMYYTSNQRVDWSKSVLAGMGQFPPVNIAHCQPCVHPSFKIPAGSPQAESSYVANTTCCVHLFEQCRNGFCGKLGTG